MSEEKKEDVVDLLNADNLVESISVSRRSVSEPISQTNEGEKSASSDRMLLIESLIQNHVIAQSR